MSLITYSFVKFGCVICIFHNSESLICRSTDILKSFRGSLHLRDNESILYDGVLTIAFGVSFFIMLHRIYTSCDRPLCIVEKSTNFLTAVSSSLNWHTSDNVTFCLLKVRCLSPKNFSSHPPLLNNWLNISVIFLKRLFKKRKESPFLVIWLCLKVHSVRFVTSIQLKVCT